MEDIIRNIREGFRQGQTIYRVSNTGDEPDRRGS